MTKAGIYKIKNKINGKIYIGSSLNLKSRIRQHKTDLKCKRHSNSYLQNSVNKYGLENFKFEVLEIIFLSNREELNCILKTEEAFYIELYKSDNTNFGYNIMSAKEGRLVCAESTKKKLSEYIRTPETRQKISEAGKGRAAWNKGKIGIYSEERLTRIKEARAKQVMPKWTAERYKKNEK